MKGGAKTGWRQGYFRDNSNVKPKKRKNTDPKHKGGDNVAQNKRERERIQTWNTMMHDVDKKEEERIQTLKNHGDAENIDQEKQEKEKEESEP